jgi:hypothetical protein
MEGVIVVVGIVMLALLWAWLVRPGGPDPENPQQAPQAINEGAGGLVGVAVVVIIVFIAVLGG